MPAHETTPAALDRAALRTALILLLVGSSMVVVDFTIREGTGPAFDFLNDTIGYGLIFWAVVLFARQAGPPAYRVQMAFAQAVGLLGVVVSVWVQLTQYLTQRVALPFGIAYDGITIAATVVFCLALRGLSDLHGLPHSAHAWGRSALLVAVIWGGLWASSLLGGFIRMLASGGPFILETPFGIANNPPVIYLVFIGLLGLVPPLFLLIAIVVMLNEVDSTGAMAPRPEAG